MRARTLSSVAVALALLGCDHGTKLGARHLLQDRDPIRLVDGWLALRYAENTDVGFSLLAALPEGPRRLGILAFGLVMIGILGGLWFTRRRAPALEQAGYAFLLSGALGNWLDRLVRGFVVDFIHVNHWPIFNVADVCICVGVGLLIWTRRRAVSPASA